MEFVLLFARAVLLGTFAVSVLAKLRAPHALPAAIRGLGVAGGAWVRPLAVGTVAAESLVVALLVHPGTVVAGLVVALVVLAAFTVVLVRAVLRRSSATCACFGSTTAAVGPEHLARNGVLITVAAAGLLPAGSPGGPSPVAAAAVAATAALFVVILVVSVDEVALLLRGPSRRGPEGDRHPARTSVDPLAGSRGLVH